MSLQLLPSGGFEITLKDETKIKGQFNAASLKKLSLKYGGLGFSETISLLEDKGTLTTIIDFIICSCEGEYDGFDVMKWIEEMGGIGSDEWIKLNGHFLDGFIAKKKIETSPQ